LNGGGTYTWEIANATGSAGTGWDQLNATGLLTIGSNATSTFTIAITSSGAPANWNYATTNQTWDILDYGTLSGFNASDWTCGLLGYALLIGGFVGHVLINHFFDSGFNAGEVALGHILFGLFALVFVVTALLTPQYNRVNLGLGITGFSVMALVLALYLIIRYGTRGTWNMVHSLWYRKAGK
jgi:hypothetical protein